MLGLNGSGSNPRRLVGGKAAQLDHLISLGFRVPPTLVVPVGEKVIPNYIADHIEKVFGQRPPWNLAIRSSAVIEDGLEASKAGHFLSVLGTFDVDALASAVHQVQLSGPEMAVVIQPLLDAKISGVGFSCHPLNYDRQLREIAWTYGVADQLVSGSVSGVSVTIDEAGKIIQGSWPLDSTSLIELGDALSRLEINYCGPVDIEWVIDKDNRFWIVQVRPIVLPKSDCLKLERQEHFDALPRIIHAHPKIRLRQNALECGVRMAPAAIEWWSRQQTPISEPIELGKVSGISVVLLHPERINNKVLREFVSIGNHEVEFFTRGCRRYAIRRYPKTTGIARAKNSVLCTGLGQSWLSVAIIQAIWDAFATGIIRCSTDGYLIEVAQGHFVPKGVVPTSTILLNRDRKIISETWRDQPTSYHFIDGHVVTVTPPDDQLRLCGSLLSKIAEEFDPLFQKYKNAALEFGLVEMSGETVIYLIDVAEADEGELMLDSDLISSGVLSVGQCTGKIHRVSLSSIEALDRHLHDHLDEETVHESVVVLAERASVDLLPLVGAPGVVGFIFERGSILAHLAVVLREKAIPAICIEDLEMIEKLNDGVEVHLDAQTRLLSARGRVTIRG